MRALASAAKAAMHSAWKRGALARWIVDRRCFAKWRLVAHQFSRAFTFTTGSIVGWAVSALKPDRRPRQNRMSGTNSGGAGRTVRALGIAPAMSRFGSRTYERACGQWPPNTSGTWGTPVAVFGNTSDTITLQSGTMTDRCRPQHWLVAGSLRAGRRAAAVMSLIQPAWMNGHDPYAYLRDALTRLPAQPASRLEELLPHHWRPATA
jgi:hypothetical protein